jgi:hypothetical protein
LPGHSGTSGNLVSAGAALHCPHGGRALVASAPCAVRVDGLPVRTTADVFAVTGCRHTVDGVPHPCATIRWSPPRGGVLIDGSPVVLDTTAAQCFSAALVPQGPPLVPSVRRGVVSR